MGANPPIPVLERFPDRQGVLTLYKFRKCSELDGSLERLFDLLRGGLWFTPLGMFNDPFEGRPIYRPQFDDQSRQSEAMIRRFKKIARERGVKGRDVYATASRLRGQRRDFMKYDATGLQEFVRRECFVYSMAANHDHPLMWSHYADEHRGVCVHFDATRTPFGSSLLVDYSVDYPAIVLPGFDEDSAFREAALRKADYWNYETEYRLVSVRGDNPSWDLGLAWDEAKRRAQIDPSGIVGMTLGATMPAATKQLLRNWRNQNMKALELFDARLSAGHFRLELGDSY